MLSTLYQLSPLSLLLPGLQPAFAGAGTMGTGALPATTASGGNAREALKFILSPEGEGS